MTIPIISHRGCPPLAPENSLAGIRAAADQGADGIELDIRHAIDGVPVIFHGRSLKSITGLPWPVRIFPSSLLKRMRLRPGGERIPLLSEALECLPERMFVALDVKEARASRAVLRLIRERRMEGRTLLWSSQERTIANFVREAPEVEVSLIRGAVDPEGQRRFLEDADHMGARGVLADWRAINPQFVGGAHERGLRVYSLNQDLESVAKKAATGLDAIMTNHPREVRAILENPGRPALGKQ